MLKKKSSDDNNKKPTVRFRGQEKAGVSSKKRCQDKSGLMNQRFINTIENVLQTSIAKELIPSQSGIPIYMGII